MGSQDAINRGKKATALRSLRSRKPAVRASQRIGPAVPDALHDPFRHRQHGDCLSGRRAQKQQRIHGKAGAASRDGCQYAAQPSAGCAHDPAGPAHSLGHGGFERRGRLIVGDCLGHPGNLFSHGRADGAELCVLRDGLCGPAAGGFDHLPADGKSRSHQLGRQPQIRPGRIEDPVKQACNKIYDR